MAIVGIDLGTTYSAVAILRDKGPEIVPNTDGDRTTPSVVGLTRKNDLLVGIKAKRSAANLSAGPIEEIKRHMGKSEKTQFGAQSLSPQEISAYILDKLVKDAESHLGEKVNGAVITIPAYFQEPARAATREAGEIAGLTIGGILDEPSAAAIAYGLKKKEDLTVLVYDFGGGTTDISLIQIAEGVFEVLAIDGDNRLGGKDFDQMIVNHCLDHLRKNFGQDFSNDRRVKAMLHLEAEKAKKDLSGSDHTSILIPQLTAEIELDVELTRALFEDMIREKVMGTKKLLQNALDKAELKLEDIDNVLLVGGSTRIPLVQQAVREFVKKEPLKDINPDECVAMGAAVYTGVVKWPDEIKAREPKLPDVRRLKDEEGKSIVVEPVLRTAHPLGVVVLGAEDDLETVVIIDRGTQYPVSITKDTFGVVQNGQRVLKIPVQEGDSEMPKFNVDLGEVKLDLPAGLEKGEQVSITFTINQDRILDVEVSLPKQPGVGVKASVQSPGRLSEEERRRIIKERVQTPTSGGAGDVPRQMAQGLIAEARKILKTSREYLDPALVSKVEQTIVALEDAAETGNLKAIMEKGNDLKAAINEIKRKFR